ncbi:MAG: hypothetical protein MRJ68_04310 [Nitrospira sp.]|nr:hypothetical protein [Nitrospira sp.]
MGYLVQARRRGRRFAAHQTDLGDMQRVMGFLSHRILVDQNEPGHLIALAQWRGMADADAVRGKI